MAGFGVLFWENKIIFISGLVITFSKSDNQTPKTIHPVMATEKTVQKMKCPRLEMLNRLHDVSRG